MIKPLNDKVLVKKIKSEEKTQSGIILANTMKNEPEIAEVLEISNYQSSQIKKGDKVLFSKYTGIEFKHNGENLIILKNADILAIVE